MTNDTKGAVLSVLLGFAAIAVGGLLGGGFYMMLKDVGGGHDYAPPAAGGIDVSGLEPEIASLVIEGHDIVANQGLCYTCHKIGDEGNGVLGPELTGIGERAAERVQGYSATQYIVESLYEPKAYTVEGFIPGTMMPVTGPPSNLGPDQILKVVAYLESLGGTVTVTPDTDPRSLLPHLTSGSGAPGATAPVGDTEGGVAEEDPAEAEPAATDAEAA